MGLSTLILGVMQLYGLQLGNAEIQIMEQYGLFGLNTEQEVIVPFVFDEITHVEGQSWRGVISTGEEKYEFDLLPEAIRPLGDYPDLANDMTAAYINNELEACYSLARAGIANNREDVTAWAFAGASVNGLIDAGSAVVLKREQALYFLSNAVELAPEDGSLYFSRGMTYYNLENWESALIDFITAAKTNKYPYANYFAGMCHVELNEPLPALEYFSEALETINDDPVIYFNRAIAQYDYMEGLEETISNDSALVLAGKVCSDLSKAKNLGYEGGEELFGKLCQN